MNKINISKKITPFLAEEIGWHIGDGSMNYYLLHGKRKHKGSYSLRGHLIDDRPHYIQRIKPIFDFIYGLNISLREMRSTGVFGFQIWNNELVNFKHRIGLPLGKKSDISIPEMFLTNRNLKISIIRGIFDTDGCVYLEPKNNKLYPRLDISTISFRLANQLLGSLRDLGFRATKHTEKPNIKTNRPSPLHKISIRGIEMFHKFMNEISPKNPKHVMKYLLWKNGMNEKYLKPRKIQEFI